MNIRLYQNSRPSTGRVNRCSDQSRKVSSECNGQATLSPPRLVAVRPHTVGSAMRDGEQWYLTEYHLGYNMLQFISTKVCITKSRNSFETLNQSTPHEVFTFPYAFQGTDMAVLNGTVFYNSVDEIVSYNFKTGSVMEMKIPLSKVPLIQGKNLFRFRYTTYLLQLLMFK